MVTTKTVKMMMGTGSAQDMAWLDLILDSDMVMFWAGDDFTVSWPNELNTDS